MLHALTAANKPFVLIVNDAPDTLELIKFSLIQEGYRILTAINGREALELAMRYPFDAIISDVVMPEMDGVELCSHLKKHPRTAHTPVLLASALKTSELDSLSGLSVGADDYLEMPFRQPELLVKMARLIERSRIERHYRQIVECSPNIIYTCDKNRRIISINQTGVKFFGHTLEELNGKTEEELLAQHINDFDQVSLTNIVEALDIVLEVRNAAGIARVVEFRRTPIISNVSEFEGFHCVAQDITERQTTEQAMRDSESRYRALYQDSPLMYFVLSQDGIVVSVNKNGIDRLGYSESELIGHSVFDVFFAEDRPRVAEQIKLLNDNPSEIGQWEFRKIHKNGNIVYVSEYVRLLPQADGSSLFLVICEDVTERKRTQIALRNSETRYQTVIKNAAVIFFALDRNGTFTLSEGTSLGKLGLAPGEVVGRSLFEVYADFPDFISAARRALNGETFTVTHELSSLTFDTSFHPIFDDNGELDGVIGVAADITQRVNAEKQAAKVIEQLGEAVEREALINRISTAVRESLRVEDVFRTVVDELGVHLSLDRCHFYWFDDNAGNVTSLTQFNAPNVQPISIRSVPLDLAAQILPDFRQNGYLAFNDVSTVEPIHDLYEKYLNPHGVRSMMFIAVRVGEEIAGLISLSTVDYLRNWNQADITLALAVADQAGIALRQARLYAQAETVSRREALINSLTTAIRSSLQLSEVLQAATHELGKVLGVSRSYIRFYNSAKPADLSPAEYVYRADSDVVIPPPTAYSTPLGEYVLQKRSTVVISDLQNSPEKYGAINTYISVNAVKRSVFSAIYCPLLVDDYFRGTLCIEQTDQRRVWTEDDVVLVEAVAAQLSLGIAQAELFELTRRSKSEWKATFDAMSDAVSIFNKEGVLVRINRAGAALERSDIADLPGKKCCELRITDDAALDNCIVQKVLRTGESVTVERVSTVLQRPLLMTAEPILDDGGEMVGVVCTARDLHELRQAEAIAREHQTLLTHILEGVLEPIFAVDATGKMVWCNKATVEIYGVEANEIARRDFVEMTHPDDHEFTQAALEASLKKKPQFFESRYLTGAGKTRHAIFNSVSLVVGNEFNGVLWFVRDITSQKNALQQALQAEKLRALGQLASGVAHDFNNVLAIILGRTSLLQRQLSDDHLRQNLKIIQTAAEDAAATVKRIQTFASQTTGENYASIEVCSLLHDSVEFTRTRWQNEALQVGVLYDVELSADGEFPLQGNASELREVFVNLIVNALDAMPYGGKLKISCRHIDGSVALEFADDGEGMPPEIRERIFEPFFSTKGINGTGLGLSVSYGIVEQHGGTITVDSEKGRGTVFRIILPIGQTQPEPAVTFLPAQAKKQLSVLVVDDEELVREALIEMVAELAEEVVGAPSGKEALRELETRRFDVVFTDLSMPEMDGWELAQKIRQHHQDVKTVLVTGYGKVLAPNAERNALVNAIIGKPFNFEQLNQTLEKISQSN